MRLIDADADKAIVDFNVLNKIIGDLQGDNFEPEDILEAVLDYIDSAPKYTNAPTVQREYLEADAMRYRYIKERVYSDMESWTLPEIQEPNDYKYSSDTSRFDYAVDKAMLSAAQRSK